MENKIKKILRKSHLIFFIVKKIRKIRFKFIILFRIYTFLIFKFFKLKKELNNKEITNIKLYKKNEWIHPGIYYFLGEYNSKIVFIKYMGKSSIALNEWNAYEELKTSTLFDSKYFIKYLCYKRMKDGGLIVSEYLKGKTLREMKLNEREKIKISQKLIKILDILYDAKIIHRDINPSNIYFEEGDKEKLKIIDFAYSLSQKKNSLLEEQIKDNEILKLLNLKYNLKPFFWDDFYSLKIIFKEDLRIKDYNISSKIGRLYHEKNIRE